MSDTVIGSGEESVSAGPGDTVEVLSGARSDSAVLNGATETVFAGGTAYFSMLNGGTQNIENAGTANLTRINSAGIQNIENGGTATSTDIFSGGIENVSGISGFQGHSDYSIIFDGGVQNVLGGLGTGVEIQGGGLQVVSEAGNETGTIIDAGGIQRLLADPGSSLSASVFGTEDVAGGTSISAVVRGGGVESVSSHGAAISTEVQSSGTLTVSATGSASGTVIDNGGMEIIQSGGTESGAVVSSGGVLVMSGGSATDVTFQNGAIVDYAQHTYMSGDTAAIDPDTHVLTIRDASGNIIDQSITVAADQPSVTLTFADSSGKVIGSATVCYVEGTRILTPTGERLVEDIEIGDVVVTRFNGFKPVKWIGRQSYAADEIRGDRERMPIRIRANALADGLPARDLLVSPGHSMLVEGTLVLAKNLVNGITVTQETLPGRLEYYQFDVGTHDCVVAEGTWSETFADGEGLRESFHNVQDFYAMFPEHRPPEELVALCAPRPLKGAALSAVLQPVIARATAGRRAGTLQGFVDLVNGDWKLEGWARDEANPETPVNLEVLIGGQVIGTVLACDFRADLLEALGEGYHKFVFESPIKLRADALRTLEVRRAADAAPLPFSDKMKQSLDKSSRPAAVKLQLSLVKERGNATSLLKAVG
jgi:autotransporter passenger strand-loop-strand repeat protein